MLSAKLVTIGKVSAQEPAIRESVEKELVFPVKPANPNL